MSLWNESLKNFTAQALSPGLKEIFACYMRHKKCVMSEFLMDILRPRHGKKTP